MRRASDITIAPSVPTKTRRNRAGILVVLPSAMSTPRRWKILCALFATTTTYAWLREPAPLASGNAAYANAKGHARRGALRLSPAALGVSPQELVEQMLEARDVTAMRPIAERLATIGGDESITPLLPLVSDERTGVRDLVLDVIGKFGTDRAVDTLIGLTKDVRHGMAESAIYALGETGNPKAEAFLLERLARAPSYDVIQAVAKFAVDSEPTVRALARVAETATDENQRYAFEVLGTLHTPTANAALTALIDSPNVTTARRAMEYLEEVDEPTLAKLSAIAQSGDAELGRSAVDALGDAGEAAEDILVDIATNGTGDLRAVALRGLGKVKTPGAFETLTELAETMEGDLAQAALESIARFDTPDARDFLISAAMSERASANVALVELAGLPGEDIDAALLAVAKSDARTSVPALRHLLTREHPDAIALVTQRARGDGDEQERLDTLELLASNGAPAARKALVEIVRDERGSLKIKALEMLGREGNGDPAVGALLKDALRSADSSEATAAASALASFGTADARDALIAALSTRDPDVVTTAARSLESYRLDDAAAAALARAAETTPDVSPFVMRKLLAVGSPHGVRLAEAALHSGDSGEALRAVETLREVQSPAALKLVEEAVHTGEGEMRAVAVRALAESRDPRHVDVIVSALDDSDPNVRQNVAYALRTVGGDKARSALITLSRSSDVDDRVVAVQTLRNDEDPAAQSRLYELLRDPAPRVVDYTMNVLAGDSRGAGELRRMVLDGGQTYAQRYRAAMALQRYGELDDRTSEWLAAASDPDE